MAEIRCPHCGQTFEVDESEYAKIVSQVRDKEFQNEISIHEQLLDQAQESKIRDATRDLKEELSQNKIDMQSLENTYQLELKKKDVQIDLLEQEVKRWKEFRNYQSTKMIGEDLEQYCFQQFREVQAMGFPRATFEKDTKAVEHSQGDFIFRDYDEDGTEIVSIMFDMKNEQDTTGTKKTNRHFLAELDKDRNLKNCEYAVLVSMLEPDDDYYNTGIAEILDYPKMYVVRPQFFIQIITIIRNAALNSLKDKKALIEMQNREIDITNFENELNDFKEKYKKFFDYAKSNHDGAIKSIDKAISDLNSVKELLTTSTGQLRTDLNKVNDLSIRKLTKNSPSLRADFEKDKKK